MKNESVLCFVDGFVTPHVLKVIRVTAARVWSIVGSRYGVGKVRGILISRLHTDIAFNTCIALE